MAESTPTQIGPHRLYLGDAYTILPHLGYFDALVTDPPYAFDNSGGGAFRKARGASDAIVDQALDRGFDHAIIDPVQCGAVVIFCHNNQLPELIGDLAEFDPDEFEGLITSDMLARLRQKFHRAVPLVWIKPNPSPNRNKHYLADTEHYVHAWHKGFHPQGEHHDLHRWISEQPLKAKVYGHPTVKPDRVMNKIIRNVAGTTVCDPFMGTGSTGVAAIRAGKVFTGIEHNPDHFATAVARITAAFNETTKFEEAA